jgi:EPS-associated MarR family transcriptional regulator
MDNNKQPHTREEVFQILRMLSNGEHLNQRQLSQELGFSLGKTNYLLKNLAKIGLIELKNFSTKNNKSKKVKYLLTKKGLKHKIDLTYKYMRKEEVEYNELKKEWERSERSERSPERPKGVEGSIEVRG